MSQHSLRKVCLLLCLAALPLIVGSQCAFFFSSGGGSSDDNDKDRKDDTIIVVTSGRFQDPAVQGVSFESGDVSGVTDENGGFRYEDGNTVQFSIGDIDLGTPVRGKSVITTEDLSAEGAPESLSASNILRFLRSLDSDPQDDVITVPADVRVAAVKSNTGISSAIESLDFSDEQNFTNAASHLVAVLTNGYPFTASLVDEDRSDPQRRRVYTD